jgi:hypothetical protein
MFHNHHVEYVAEELVELKLMWGGHGPILAALLAQPTQHLQLVLFTRILKRRENVPGDPPPGLQSGQTSPIPFLDEDGGLDS